MNTCIGSAPRWEDETGDPGQAVNDTISNMRSEGISPRSIRIYVLSNMQRFKIRGLGWRVGMGC